MSDARWIVAVALVASPALAQTPSGDACAFRAATMAALFTAAGDAGAATRLLAAGDAPAAQAPLAAVAARLREERRRIGSDGRGLVDAQERRRLRRALGSTVRRAAKAAARARRSPVERVTRHASAAADEIERILSEQIASRDALDCAGGEIRVPELVVGAGETRRVPGGFAIVAERGVEIRGDLVTSGGLAIEAEDGDVVLEGRIDARGGATLERTARRTGAQGAPRGGAAPTLDCADAEDLTIRARRGDVRIGASFSAASADGRDCAALVLTDRAQLEESTSNTILHLAGRRGGKGGTIVVSAPTGAIRFATQPLDDPGIFWPGDGGAGQDVAVDPQFVPPAGFATVLVSGGPGGSAGSLRLEARSADVLPLFRVFVGGDGGRGGNVEWDVRSGSALFPSGLAQIDVSGGDGGFGAVAGGRGGDARYQGDRLVNAPGEPTTAVSVFGGSGGRALADVPRMPGDETEGGGGGNAEATGHRGADGTEAEPQGADGGSASALGGEGRHVPDDLAQSTGGAGGSASGRGGRGGNGWPSCTAPPGAGGGGGAGGEVTVFGGQGGDAEGGRGGDGGDSLLAASGQPGDGGDGAPAGECGAVPEPSSGWGDGGRGAVPGEEGTAADEEITVCAGDVFTCDEIGPRPDPCARPQSYSAFISIHQGAADGSAYSTRSTSSSGHEVCIGFSCTAYHSGTYTHTRKFPLQPETTTTQSFAYESPNLSAGLGLLFGDHCTADGVLHRAGESNVDIILPPGGPDVHTITHSCSGACACGASAVQCCLVGNVWRLWDARACP
jgi:hypothetical protein